MHWVSGRSELFRRREGFTITYARKLLFHVLHNYCDSPFNGKDGQVGTGALQSVVGPNRFSVETDHINMAMSNACCSARLTGSLM
jgi:hypothetical protein